MDLFDTVLSWGGTVTAGQRAVRLLKLHRQSLLAESRVWRASRRSLEAQRRQLAAQATSQRQQLLRWGLTRLVPPFAALAESRVRRASLLGAMAESAQKALECRAEETRLLVEEENPAVQVHVVFENSFCDDTATEVLARCAELSRLREQLDSLELEVQSHSARVTELRPRLELKSREARALLLRASLSEASAAVAAVADFEEVVADEREREGRLLARWHDRAVRIGTTPREILAFGNYLGVSCTEGFALSPEEKKKMRSMALDLTLRRSGESLLMIPAQTAERLDGLDRRWQDAQIFVEEEQGLGDYFEATSAVLAGLDVEETPAGLLRCLLAAFAKLHVEASPTQQKMLSADDVLPALVRAMVRSEIQRPHRAAYLIRQYALNEATLGCERHTTAEADYFTTTFDAALKHVTHGQDNLRIRRDSLEIPTEEETELETNDDIFEALASAVDEEDHQKKDQQALTDLGSWIGAHSAMEDTVELLQNEGWMA